MKPAKKPFPGSRLADSRNYRRNYAFKISSSVTVPNRFTSTLR